MNRAVNVEDELAIAGANERFYQALEAGNLKAMEAVWLQADWVKCVHPGWELITGWDGIAESWRRLFINSGGIRVSTSDVQIQVAGDFAWVSCTENLSVFLEGKSAPMCATTAATNLFQRVGSSWLMVHHHASPTRAPGTISATDKIQ